MERFDIGFTGTRKGLTKNQEETLLYFLTQYKMMRYDIYVHHGDCVGADEQFHQLALENEFKIIVHPPTEEGLRAFCKDFTEIWPRKTYLQRDHEIVLASDILIACPEEKPKRNSGTLYTLNYAKEKLIQNFEITVTGMVIETKYHMDRNVSLKRSLK